MTVRVGVRAAVAAFVATAAVSAYALGMPTTGYTFAMGGHGSSKLDLKIDSHATWNGVFQPESSWYLKDLSAKHDQFFKIDDIKPGDIGEATISLHVNKDAWICLDIENLKEKENGRNEPELLEDNSGGSQSGELADGTEFFAWYDDKNTGGASKGDNVFQVGEDPIFGEGDDEQSAVQVLDDMTYALADSKAGEYYEAGKTRYIGILWCAGDLQVDLDTAEITCDGEAMGNEAQTDSFSVDISFRAVKKSDQPKFTCEKQGTTCKWPGKIQVSVNNNAQVYSNTSSYSNTGGNSGDSVYTGSASSNASSWNRVNWSRFRW